MRPKIPIVRISKKFTFEAAHRLPAVPDDHPCSKLHGHTYTVEIELTGALDPQQGWLMDYKEISSIVKPIIEDLDHSCLNDRPDLTFTTAEELAVWIWDRIREQLPLLSRVSVQETPSSRCDYFGESSD